MSDVKQLPSFLKGVERSARGFFALLKEDLEAAEDNDPAAENALEVALTYPGVQAVWGYRTGHVMWNRGWKLPARILQNVTRFLTGVDIHPAARLGRRLFIDHAEGVVIGETAEVGEDVLIFHQVTLGGVSMSPGKRHPTVKDRAIIGAGAKILGPITIGCDAKIGANAVVVKDVPPGAVAVGIPARLAKPGTKDMESCTH